jgi:6-phosphogluconolactonase
MSGDTVELLVGTSSSGAHAALRYAFDTATGELRHSETLGAAVTGPVPGWWVVTPRAAYAFNEVEDGTVTTFARDAATGALTPAGPRCSTGGSGPCHAVITATTQPYLVVANYTDGSAAVLPIDAGTRLPSDPTDVVRHSGSGPVADRQRSAHCHQAVTLPVPGCPDDAFVLLVDLGTDRVTQWRLDGAAGKLAPNPAGAAFHTEAGVGPRHMVVTATHGYIAGELDASVTVAAFDPAVGVLGAQMGKVSTLPSAVPSTAGVFPAAIVLAPDARTLYLSNRGTAGAALHNSIAVFAIAAGSGLLRMVQCVEARGGFPRCFALVGGGGAWLVAANQHASTLAVWRRDVTTGLLEAVAAPPVAVAPEDCAPTFVTPANAIDR